MSSPYPELDMITGFSAATGGFQVPAPILAYPESLGVATAVQLDSGNVSFVDMDVSSFAHVGIREKSYVDDLYYRIHVTPGRIDLGNVLSVQTEEIRIWNAYFATKDMTDYVEPLSEGVTVTEPVTTPYIMAPLGELSYIVTVAQSGPPQFSTAVLWTIDGVDYSVDITGRRVVVWPFGPNWRQPVNESLEWKTDIITAFSGVEQRRPIRSKPRRRFNYEITLTATEAQQFQNTLFGWQDRQYALPVWVDQWPLVTPVSSGDTVIPVDTDTRGFWVTGLAVIMSDTQTFEVVEVETINADNIVITKPLGSSWAARAKLYPLNLATLPTNVTTQRLTSRVMQSNVEFLSDPVNTDPYVPVLSAIDTFNGEEIIYRKPNWVSPIQYVSEKEFDFLDFDIGGVQQIQRPTGAKQARQIRWLLKDRQDIKGFRGLLGRLRGRNGVAYVPTWFDDFTLYEAAGSGTSAIRVKANRYADFVGTDDAPQAVLIRLKDGTKILRNVIGSTDSFTGTELINLDALLPEEVNPGNVMMISLVHLCRLQQDGVTINYQSDSVAIVEMNMITVSV